jgi:phage/plasmid-associated DNA primase
MTDADIDNCHPVIVENYCRQRKWTHSHITYFNENRKKLFKEIQDVLGQTKEETKPFFLSLLNGGGGYGEPWNADRDEKLKKLGWFSPFMDELAQIRKLMYGDHPELQKMAKKAKGKDKDGKEYWNLEGVVFSYIMCSIENQLLQICVNYCALKGVKISALIYDGFMFYTNTLKQDHNEFLRGIEAEIKRRTDYTIKMSIKEMDEGIDIPSDYAIPYERERLEQEAEKARKEAERKKKEEEREAEKVRKEAEREAEREVERARKEADRRLKEEEREADKVRKEAEREAEKEVERARKEAERKKKEEEREEECRQKEAEKEANKIRREMEKQAKKVQREIEQRNLRESRAEQKRLKQEAKEQEEKDEKSDREMADIFLEEKKDDIVYDTRSGKGYFYREDIRLWAEFENFDALDELILESLEEIQMTKDLRNVSLIVRRKLMNREDDLTEFNMRKGILALKDNAVFDMRTREMRERRKTDLCSFFLPYYYEPHYDKAWVNEYIGSLVCMGKERDTALIEQVCELAGYTFTGENNLKLIMLLVGALGDNGKSGFVECIQGLLGQYAVAGSGKLIKKQRFENDTHQAHLFPIIGKRGVFVAELKDTDEFNVDGLKLLSGNDKQSIRNSGSGKTISTTLKAPLWIPTNEVPKFQDKVFGKRLACIPFRNVFARDANKEAEIKSHWNDLFCAYLDGAFRYYERGQKIELVDTIKNYTTTISNSKDPFIQFIQETEYEVSAEDKEYCKDIFYYYIEFTRKMNCSPEGKETFYKRFETKYDIVKNKDKNGYYYTVKQI